MSGNERILPFHLQTPSPKEGRRVKRQRASEMIINMVVERHLKPQGAILSSAEARFSDLESKIGANVPVGETNAEE